MRFKPHPISREALRSASYNPGSISQQIQYLGGRNSSAGLYNQKLQWGVPMTVYNLGLPCMTWTWGICLWNAVENTPYWVTQLKAKSVCCKQSSRQAYQSWTGCLDWWEYSNMWPQGLLDWLRRTSKTVQCKMLKTPYKNVHLGAKNSHTSSTTVKKAYGFFVNLGTTAINIRSFLTPKIDLIFASGRTYKENHLQIFAKDESNDGGDGGGNVVHVQHLQLSCPH